MCSIANDSLAMYFVPLSETIESGTPNLAKISRKKVILHEIFSSGSRSSPF